MRTWPRPRERWKVDKGQGGTAWTEKRGDRPGKCGFGIAQMIRGYQKVPGRRLAKTSTNMTTCVSVTGIIDMTTTHPSTLPPRKVATMIQGETNPVPHDKKTKSVNWDSSSTSR